MSSLSLSPSVSPTLEPTIKKCPICEDWRSPYYPNATVTFPGFGAFTCYELNKLGLASEDILVDNCLLIQLFAFRTCGCDLDTASPSMVPSISTVPSVFPLTAPSNKPGDAPSVGPSESPSFTLSPTPFIPSNGGDLDSWVIAVIAVGGTFSLAFLAYSVFILLNRPQEEEPEKFADLPEQALSSSRMNRSQDQTGPPSQHSTLDSKMNDPIQRMESGLTIVDPEIATSLRAELRSPMGSATEEQKIVDPEQKIEDDASEAMSAVLTTGYDLI
mmetsp:Transcript_16406/g.25503  ORF Transcript_16406/g.25503 Transcript_16406/m.25503 type:complete len:273 (+) Transcript_16406:274-1092(+)|eukprot:CAMPEP_0195297146 /NCGR_PEP_ID=MMETSP0707-20130614/20918_1 /TAXON_ID=33640 /ORGANISM="Asterionellopsis glacialis, Strain CCMP134" /LENGTH=272 /DNA_ID=CAMNT_0040358867 /DNA_START=196 /DNA_END=1014 /DNA_ORIENTATION=+